MSIEEGSREVGHGGEDGEDGAEAAADAWGTLEERLPAYALNLHGTKSWDSIAETFLPSRGTESFCVQDLRCLFVLLIEWRRVDWHVNLPLIFLNKILLSFDSNRR